MAAASEVAAALDTGYQAALAADAAMNIGDNAGGGDHDSDDDDDDSDDGSDDDGGDDEDALNGIEEDEE